MDHGSQRASLQVFFPAEIFSQMNSAYTLLGELGEPPLGQISPKGEKTCPDSMPAGMQNFTRLALSVTVQKNKNKQKMTNKQPDGCIVWNAHNTVLGEEALLIYIVPVCYVKTGRHGKS